MELETHVHVQIENQLGLRSYEMKLGFYDLFTSYEMELEWYGMFR